MRPAEDTEVRRQETDYPDRHRRSEIPANDLHIDLGAGEKGQEDRPEPREIVHPGCQGHVDEVAGDRADDDFEQSHGNRDPGLHRRGDQRQPDPQRRGQPDIVHPKTPLLARKERVQRRFSLRRLVTPSTRGANPRTTPTWSRLWRIRAAMAQPSSLAASAGHAVFVVIMEIARAPTPINHLPLESLLHARSASRAAP